MSRTFVDPEFCLQCGAFMPLPDVKAGFTVCPCCGKKRPAKEIRDEVRLIYKKVYNDEKAASSKETTGTSGGPVVDRPCSKCGNKKMAYATRQTRSADEGMTVFFTCLKCGHKDIEYS